MKATKVDGFRSLRRFSLPNINFCVTLASLLNSVLCDYWVPTSKLSTIFVLYQSMDLFT